ncbi:MAG: DUF523 domain-containing protein [Deltaproteobacteria bacterium]|nr:DUF523 domain-containing protein [Deltaproteobacteria bacterium]
MAAVEVRGPLLVSACLAGVRCRYDGRAKTSDELLGRCRELRLALVPVCPEQLGGLPTPRPPAAFRGGDGRRLLAGQAGLFTAAGLEVSEKFLAGARQAALIARVTGARGAVFQEKSPACGVEQVYLDGRLQPGCGVCTALLRRQEGLSVWSVAGFLGELAGRQGRAAC